MNEDKIDSYVDRSGVQSDTQFMLDNLNQIKDSYLALSKIKVGINGIEGLSQLGPMLQQATQQTQAYDQAISGIAAKQAQMSAASKEAAQAALFEAKARKEDAAAATEESKQKLNEAKATTESARASKEAAQAKAAEAKAQYDSARAAQIGAKYTEQLNKSKDQLNKAALKEAELAGKLNNEYEQLKALYAIAANTAKQLAAAKGLDNAETKEAIAAAQQYYQKLIAIEKAVGQNQRNVGNYTQATFALTQVLREAPAFANSFATGISAISNNLPMLIDEIKKLKEANVALKEAGQKTIPIFQTFAKSLFSLTGILPIAFLLVQLFGKEISAFVSNLFNAGDGVKDLADKLSDLAEQSRKAKERLAELRKESEFLKELGAAIDKINFGGTSAGDYLASRLSAQTENVNYDNLIYELTEQSKASADRFAEARKLFDSVISNRQNNKLSRYRTAGTGIVDFNRVTQGVVGELDFSERQKLAFEGAKKAAEEYYDLLNQISETSKKQGLLRVSINEMDDAENKRLAKEAIALAIDRYDQEKKAAFEAAKYKLEQAIEAEKKIVAIRDGLEAPQLERAKQARERQAAFELELIQKTADFERSQGNVVSESALADAVRVKLKRQELTQAELAIVKEAYEQEVKSRQLTASEIELINKKESVNRRLTLFAWVNDTKEATRLALRDLALYAEETSKLLKKAGLEEEERVRALRISNIEKQLAAGLSVISQESLTKRTDLTDLYFQGIKSKQQYEKEIYKIEYEATKKSLELQIKKYSQIVLLNKLTPEEQEAAYTKLNEARRALQELNVSFTVWLKETDSDLITILDKYKQVAFDLAGSIGGILNASNEKQKNAIQEQIDLIELKKQKDIEAAEQSATSQEEAAARIAIINAKAQTQREILERRQAVLNQKRARYEKALTISQIIADTSLAVVRALGMKPYTPANIAQAAIVGVLGAAKLAAAIATPIPQYKHGKSSGDNYEGPAIVGDGGRAELIQRENGSFEVTPATPTLTYVGRKDIIHPDASVAMKLTAASMAKKAEWANVEKSKIENSRYDMDGVRADLNRGFRMLSRTIKNKTEYHFERPKPFDRITRFKDGNREYCKRNGIS